MVRTASAIGILTLLVMGYGWGAAGAAVDLSDPTRPTAWAQPSAKPQSRPRRTLVLQATLVSPSRRAAIINGRSYELGARVGRSVITDIKAYEVTLTRKGRQTHLRFFPRLVEHKDEAADAADATLR